MCDLVNRLRRMAEEAAHRFNELSLAAGSDVSVSPESYPEWKAADEIERLKDNERILMNRVKGKDAEIERLFASKQRLLRENAKLKEDKKTLSKAIMELGELVPDKKFWACPTCTRVNPSTRKTCYMKHGEEGADDA